MAVRKKRDGARRALERLYGETGSLLEVWEEIVGSGGLNALGQPTLAQILAGKKGYDDLAAAIIFGSFLEKALEIALSSHLAPDTWKRMFSYDDDGPLATFAAKINMAHGLRVYDDRMRKDLVWIKNIRNAFAHVRVRIDFNTEAIVLCCDELELPKAYSSQLTTPRKKYTGTIALLSSYLLTPLSTKKPLRFQREGLYSQLYGKTPPSSPQKS
jgi:hypothetical protein